jgi:glycosyltransferase involved in cell wall biosynthesis
VPYVLAPNGTAPILERRLAAKRLFDVIAGRDVLTRASRVIAVSHAEHRQLCDLGVSTAALRLIPNPVDLDEFGDVAPRGHFRQRYGLGSQPVVLFLGKITPRKRVDDLVQAFARLERHHAVLVIAGNDMGGTVKTRALIQTYGLEQRCILTGLLRSNERLEALAEADVVVYPSEHEIFGLVPLESLLSGTPVIVADDSGCGEIVRATGGGLLVPVGDVAALAGAIERILDGPSEWRAAAAKAGTRVKDLYGAAAVCDDVEALYREMVAAA